MSWNRPNNADDKVQDKGVPRGKGILAGLIVILVCGFAVYLVFRGDGRSEVSHDPKHERKIAAVDPAATSLPIPQVSTNKSRRIPYWEVDASQTNGFTEVMRRKWEQVRRPRMKPVKIERKKQPYEIFRYSSENRIAMYLAVEPGKGFIGRPIFGKRFEEDFEKSCTEPIVVEETDDDYTKSLKQAMKEAKIEIKNRMRNGMKIDDIMMTTHLEMQKLGEYKREMEKMVREGLDKVETEADANSLIEAANKMLSAKGIGPIGKSPVIRTKIARALKANKAHEKE